MLNITLLKVSKRPNCLKFPSSFNTKKHVQNPVKYTIPHFSSHYSASDYPLTARPTRWFLASFNCKGSAKKINPRAFPSLFLTSLKKKKTTRRTEPRTKRRQREGAAERIRGNKFSFSNNDYSSFSAFVSPGSARSAFERRDADARRIPALFLSLIFLRECENLIATSRYYSRLQPELQRLRRGTLGAAAAPPPVARDATRFLRPFIRGDPFNFSLFIYFLSGFFFLSKILKRLGWRCDNEWDPCDFCEFLLLHEGIVNDGGGLRGRGHLHYKIVEYLIGTGR